MAIIKSFAPFLNLSNYQTFLVDENPNSNYFRISEFKETLTGGKNGFLIEGSPYLKETTEVKIEILDVEGNPIYFEPGDGIPEYYEGTSKLVSVHIYDDTPIGIGKITILGELKNYIENDGQVLPIPSEWQGAYNVKWESEFKINKNLNNEDIVRFYKRPNVYIEELVKPIFSKSIPTATDTGLITGVPQIPTLDTNLTSWRAGTNYKLIRDTGSWDRDVDENVINIDVNGTPYSPKIIEVLNDRELLVDVPYTENNFVKSFVSQSYSVSYSDFQNEIIGETVLTGSFAKINIQQLKTFVGDVARVKVFRKSRSEVGDFKFVQESKLESTELLRDIYATNSTEIPYGRFDEYNLSRYWETSSIDHPTTIDSSVLSQAVKVDYNGSGVQKLITSQSFDLSKDVEYTLNFRTILSGSADSSKTLKAYFSGSFINSLGNPTSYIQNFLTISGSGVYNVRQNVSQNILAERNIPAKLVFEFVGDDWYISNVSLKNAQDTSFSPDEFTLIQDIPRKLAIETFDFRFEFYDINNNYIPVTVTATKEFDGGNDYPTSGKLLTFESDRNAFRYSSGSANPANQQIKFSVTSQNLTGSVLYDWLAYDVSGSYITESGWEIYPGELTTPNNAGALLKISDFEGTWTGSGDKPEVYSITYTASREDLEEFETVYRLEDGDNAPTLLVTSNANQFIYEPTTLSPKPSGQNITIRAQRKNLASLSTPITVNSGSNLPPLNYVNTQNGIDTYTLSATEFSASFASTAFDEVTYSFTGSDVFGDEQTDEITISKVVNFDGVSLVLSNESATFPANSTGEVLGGFAASSGSVQMYIGGNQIQFDDNLSKNTFAITNLQGSGCTPFGGNGYDPLNNSYSITAMSTDSASMDVTVTYKAGDNSTTQEFQKVVSYTKAKKGVPTILTKASPASQTINSSSLGFEVPQNVEIFVMEGGDEYYYTATSLTGGLAQVNKFNIVSIVSGSNESTEGVQSGSILPETGSNGTNGSALVSYVNSEGTLVQNKTIRFDVGVSKIGKDGLNGSSGSDAQVVSLSANQYTIPYDGDGNEIGTNTITLTATAKNFEDPEYRFLKDGVEKEAYSSTSTYVIDNADEPGVSDVNLWEVQVRENGGTYDGVFDNIDIFGLKDGSDSFTVFLTNEAHTFAADSVGKITSDLTDGAFEVRFFRGTTQYDFDDTVTPAENTYNVSVVGNNIDLTASTTAGGDRKFTPKTGTWNVSNSVTSGTATVTITDNATNAEFEKLYTFSKSKKGAASVSAFLSPQSQTIDSGSSITNIAVSVKEGDIDLTAVSSITDNSQYTATISSPYTFTPATELIARTGNPTVAESKDVTISYRNSEGTDGSLVVPLSVGVAKQGLDGKNGVVITQLPPSQTIKRSTSGTYATPSIITTLVTENGSAYTYSSTLASNSTFKITDVSTGSTLNANGTITPKTPTTTAGETITFKVTYKTSLGVTSSAISQTHVISVTLDGTTGPGVVHTGVWAAGRAYQYSDGLTAGTGRRDTVLWSSNGSAPYDTYYATNTSHTSTNNSSSTTGRPDLGGPWTSLGTQDFFVAAKIGIFEDSFVQKTLNIGKNENGGVSSANITLAGGSTNPYISIGQSSTIGSQGYGINGIFLGQDENVSKLSLVNGTTSFLKWTGTELQIKGNISATTGTISGTVTIGGATASTVVSGASDGASALQPSEAAADVNSNTTTINGGKIRTGNIQSTGYPSGDVTDGSDFSTQGMNINLDNGSITSPNFRIDSNGNAVFAGNLAAGTVMTDGSISGGTISGTEFFGATGTFTGTITAELGNIGGWTIADSQIYTDIMSLNSQRPALEIYTGTDISVDINSNTELSDIAPSSPIEGQATDSQSANDSESGTTSTYTSRQLLANAVSVNPAATLSSVSSQFSSGDILTFSHDGQELTAANIAKLYFNFKNLGDGSYESTITTGFISIYTRVKLKSSINGTTVATLQDINTISAVTLTNYGGGATVQTYYPTLDTTPKSTTFTYGGQTNLYLYVETTCSITFNVTQSGASTTFVGTLNTYTPSYTCTLTKEISKTEISAGGLQVVRDQANYVKMSRGDNATGAMVQVWGDITATGNITANASDRRLKDNIQLIQNPLDKINKLNGVYFNWNSIANQLAGFDTSIINVGLIAQEVEDVLPEATTLSPLDNGDGNSYKTIWYEKLVPLLIEGVKELNEKVNKLEEENLKLKNGNK